MRHVYITPLFCSNLHELCAKERIVNHDLGKTFWKQEATRQEPQLVQMNRCEKRMNHACRLEQVRSASDLTSQRASGAAVLYRHYACSAARNLRAYACSIVQLPLFLCLSDM